LVVSRVGRRKKLKSAELISSVSGALLISFYLMKVEKRGSGSSIRKEFLRARRQIELLGSLQLCLQGRLLCVLIANDRLTEPIGKIGLCCFVENADLHSSGPPLAQELEDILDSSFFVEPELPEFFQL
jgi:hypothetical protein